MFLGIHQGVLKDYARRRRRRQIIVTAGAIAIAVAFASLPIVLERFITRVVGAQVVGGHLYVFRSRAGTVTVEISDAPRPPSER